MQIVEPSVSIETPAENIASYMKLLERYGRTCHKSEDRIHEGSADDFVRRFMIEKGHESVLEHCSITARFVCDRSASHQLVRHRLGSYSQESQRAVDYSGSGLQVICPPSVRSDEVAFTRWCQAVETAERAYRGLVEDGVLPEDARSVLPNCTKTEIVATFNLRQWRHVFIERALNRRAQWEIRELMTALLKEMSQLLPTVFEDLGQKILYRMVFEDKNSVEKD